MADSKITGAQAAQPDQGYMRFSAELEHQLHLLRFRVESTKALLQRHESAESDELLVGANYLLEDIANLARNLADHIDETTFKFVTAPSVVKQSTNSPH